MSATEPEPGALSRLAPSFVRRSYTVKFVVSILVIVVVIAAAGTVGYVQARDTVETDTRESLAATASVQAAELGEYLRDKRGRAGQLATESTLLTGDTAAVSQLVTARQTQFGSEVTQIHVVDLEAASVEASTNPRIRGNALSGFDRPWANTQQLSSLPAGQAELTPRAYTVTASGSETYRIAAVAKVRGGSRAVVVVGNIGEALGDLSRPDAGQGTALLNGAGETTLAGIETTDGLTLTAGATGDGPVASTVPGGGLSVTAGGDPQFRTANGRVYAIAPVDVGGTTWAAVTSVPQSEAFAVVNAVGTTIASIVALALGALIVFGVVLGRQTVTPLSSLRRKVERMEEGDLEVDLQTTREDEIGRLYGGFASMRDSLRERLAEIEATNRRLERRAETYSEVMRACADGDLSQRMDTDTENESMGEIAREFNAMIEELESTTRDIKRFADEVAISSQEVTASADLVRDASEDVSASVREINEGAESQNDRLEAVADEMDTLSARVDEVATASDEVAAVATRTVETGREGRAAAESAVAAMERVSDESAAAVDQMESLEDETEQIDELLEFINEIAQRTNMLALNANIEANRDPQAGDDSGFGVIANEIKDLSEEAQQATEDVARRLRRIQEQTEEAAGVVEQTSQAVESSAENVEEAVTALDEIVSYAEETNEGVQSVTESNAEQVESTSAVAEQVEAVAAISERTAESSERVARLADDQASATARMSDSAGDLNSRALDLSESLDDFEFGTEEVDTGEVPDDASVDDGDGDNVGFDAAAAAASRNGDGGSGSDPDAGADADAATPVGFGADSAAEPEAEGEAGTQAAFSPGSVGDDRPDGTDAAGEQAGFRPASIEDDTDDGAGDDESPSRSDGPAFSPDR